MIGLYIKCNKLKHRHVTDVSTAVTRQKIHTVESKGLGLSSDNILNLSVSSSINPIADVTHRVTAI